MNKFVFIHHDNGILTINAPTLADACAQLIELVKIPSEWEGEDGWESPE